MKVITLSIRICAEAAYPWHWVANWLLQYPLSPTPVLSGAHNSPFLTTTMMQAPLPRCVERSTLSDLSSSFTSIFHVAEPACTITNSQTSGLIGEMFASVIVPPQSTTALALLVDMALSGNAGHKAIHSVGHMASAVVPLSNALGHDWICRNYSTFLRQENQLAIAVLQGAFSRMHHSQQEVHHV